MKFEKICKICKNPIIDSKRALKMHLKKYHNYINYEEYVIKYYYNGNYPKCKICGNNKKFKGQENDIFYKTRGSTYCIHSQKSITFEKKYYVKRNFTRPKIQNKVEKTMLEKYGGTGRAKAKAIAAYNYSKKNNYLNFRMIFK